MQKCSGMHELPHMNPGTALERIFNRLTVEINRKRIKASEQKEPPFSESETQIS